MPKLNSIVHDNLYVRCPKCGDSQNPNHAHLGIQLHTGEYNCLRCHFKGRLTTQLLFELQLRDFPSLDYNSSSPLPEIFRGPGSSRKSKLARYHSDAGEDIFYSWWNDSHVGYYMRGHKMKKLWGFSGFNWANAPSPLISSEDNPLHFVEGPYDVQDDRTVCFFGIPSYQKINQFFKEHFFILKPDGDIWTQPGRFGIFKSILQRIIEANIGLMGVEFLPKGADPDEGYTPKFIPVDFFKRQLWQNTSSSLKVQQELARLHSSMN